MVFPYQFEHLPNFSWRGSDSNTFIEGTPTETNEASQKLRDYPVLESSFYQGNPIRSSALESLFWLSYVGLLRFSKFVLESSFNFLSSIWYKYFVDTLSLPKASFHRILVTGLSSFSARAGSPFAKHFCKCYLAFEPQGLAFLSKRGTSYNYKNVLRFIPSSA